MTAISTYTPPFLSEQNGTIAVTTASAAAGPFAAAGGDTWLIQNVGSVEAFIAFGATAPTVIAGGLTTTAVDGAGMSVQPGAILTLRAEPASLYVGAITASGTTTIRVSRGSGI